MPIYEFYCPACNTIYSFYSKSVNTKKKPACPGCKSGPLQRQMSTFARLSEGHESEEAQDLPIDESRMEKALDVLSREADGLSEEDPRQAAQLMRKFTHAAGAELGPGMEEALKRLEAGEDPDQIEAEMGDLIESEEPFIFDGKGAPRRKRTGKKPKIDDKLYEL